MLHNKFHDHRTITSVGTIFEGFYYIMALRPSWPSGLDLLYILCFRLPKEAPLKIGL